MKKQVILQSIAGLISLHALSAQTLPAPVAKSQGSKVGKELLQVQQQSQNRGTAPAAKLSNSKVKAVNNLTQTKDGFVYIEAAAEPDQIQRLSKDLTALGLQEGIVLEPLISGWFPVANLVQLNALKSLHFVRAAYRAGSGAGKVTSQGDNTQRSALARSTYKVNGSGVKVGVISDSYNLLNGAPQGVRNGELPGPGNPAGFLSPVEILKEPTFNPNFPPKDEGRAMAEIVHDVAPGAKLAFYQGIEGGPANFVKAIEALVKAGCKVITDDIYFFRDPFFQDSQITQAINKATALNGVTYTILAGNFGSFSYEKPFNGTEQDAVLGPVHDFNPDPNVVDTRQAIRVAPGASIVVTLQWDQPFYSVTGNVNKAATSDLDIFLVDNEGNRLLGSDEFNVGGDPVEVLQFQNPTTTVQTYNLLIEKPELVDENDQPVPNPAPSLLKYIILNGPGEVAIDEYATNSSTVYGKQNAPSAITVGASAFYNKTAAGVPLINNFSSLGGARVLFDIAGNRISPVVRNKPEIVAPDGVNTSFFNSDIPEDTDAFPNFFGTSAATPHLAGVVALMINAVATPTAPLSPQAILGALLFSAQDMDNPATPNNFDTGFDFRTGYGFVQADKAIAAAKQFQTTRTSALASKNTKLNIAPNPAETQFQLTFTRDAEADTEVEIYNTWGKLLQRQPVHVHAGENVLQLTPNLPGAGSYILRLADRPAENTRLLRP
ncbi:S8 family serine peptidase [Hymenobacter terrenus]|uniref:S8 family serine peptidase n=1 Tax=Hymenobacter terrenus TaxID=1629124 RepID=UPI000698AFF5|nr:S8 family serine peptidase [Hymenobacter terrenus]